MVRKMKRRNTDNAAQQKRRKDAIASAAASSLWLLFSAGVLLALRWYFQINNFWGAVLVIISVLELGMIIPIWILLKTRLEEIEGGEEDAAAQY